jgi:hypothetical protein
LKNERNRAFHLLGGDFLAIDLQHTGAATTDPAHVVEGKRREAETVAFEVELDAVLARSERIRSLPANR